MDWQEFDGLDAELDLLRLCGGGYTRQDDDEGRAYSEGMFLKQLGGGRDDQ
jgi:hypothetical protein